MGNSAPHLARSLLMSQPIITEISRRWTTDAHSWRPYPGPHSRLLKGTAFYDSCHGHNLRDHRDRPDIVGGRHAARWDKPKRIFSRRSGIRDKSRFPPHGCQKNMRRHTPLALRFAGGLDPTGPLNRDRTGIFNVSRRS